MDVTVSKVDPKLLNLLVCPLTKGRLSYDREKNELISETARLAYPIRDGIPIMLFSEARRIEDRGWFSSVAMRASLGDAAAKDQEACHTQRSRAPGPATGQRVDRHRS